MGFLAGNALFQTASTGVWGAMIGAWIALGAVGGSATLGALALCAALPIIGWFIGLPIVLFCTAVGAMVWVGVLFVIFGAWALTTLVILFVTFAVSLLNSRRT